MLNCNENDILRGDEILVTAMAVVTAMIMGGV
jgi:hypothetical protein